MKYQECIDLLPTNLAIKWRNAFEYCHKDGAERRRESLQEDNFRHVGDFINYSLRWDSTEEGRSYWRTVANFYGLPNDEY
jgi:hypothetical protein